MKKIFNQSEAVKIGAICLLLILVVLIYDLPIFKTINRWHNDVKGEVLGLEAQSEQGNSFTKASLDWQQASGKLPASGQLLKNSGQELELIKQLEKIASANQLKQELKLSQNYQAWSDKIVLLGISATLTGEFSDLLDYLVELEKLNFQLTVDSVALKPATQAEATDQVEAKLLLNTYWLKK